ncbi:MAG TPA: copper resistance protein CopC [Candidatus Limnocylindrales bacterium]|nr:copper resistance protein CopC [Candidatus Limnocylindrales bacterium]
MKRVPAVLALLVLVALAGPGAADAHARLTASDPAKGATLASAPTKVTLSFTEAPDIRLTSIKVLDSAGTNHATGPVVAVAGDELSVSVPLDALSDGGYTVSWRAVSAVDGHISAGSFVFGVGEPPPTGGTAPEQPAGLSGSPPAVGARWVLYVGLILLFGAAWVAVAVARRPSSALLGMAAVGWLLTAIGTAAVVGVQWAEAEAPISTLLTTSLGIAAFARAISLGVVALALVGLVVVPALAGARGWAVVALAAAAAFTVDVVLGHAAAGPGWLLQIVAQAAHAIAAAAWIGGLAGLLVMIRGSSPDERIMLARRFSTWASVMLLVVAATGAVRALAEVGTLDNLVSSDFGRTVMGKTFLLVFLAGLGAFNHWVTIRNARRVQRWLGRVGAAEAGVALVIVGLSAMLVNQSPPITGGAAPGPSPTPAVRSLVTNGSDFGTSVKARLAVTTGAPGTNAYDLTITDYDTGAPLDAPAAALRFQATSVTGVAPARLDLTGAGPGHFQGSGDQLSIDGIWTVTATVTLPGGAVDVPFIVPTVIPAQSVSTIVSDGLPTIYVVDAGAAGTAQVYLDPGRGSDPDQLHVTLFDTDGNERPATVFTVATFGTDGVGRLLTTKLLEPGHVVGSIEAQPGPLVVDVVAAVPAGSTSSHLHLHVTIQVEPEVTPS